MQRQHRVAAGREVVRQRRLHFRRVGVGLAVQQRRGHAQVQVLPRLQADAGVDDVARQRVLEAQRAGLRAGIQEVLLGQGDQRRAVGAVAAELLEQPQRHDVADHRRRAQQLGLFQRQRLQPRIDQLAEEAGAVAQAVQRRAGAGVRQLHQRRIAQPRAGDRMAQLADEQRVAAGMAAHLREHEGVDRPEQRTGQRAGHGLVQRCQRQRAVDALQVLRTGRLARGQHDQQAQRRLAAQGQQHLLRGIVGPVPVVDAQQHRLLRRQAGQQRAGAGRRLRGGLRRRCLQAAQHLHEGLHRLGPERLIAERAQRAPALRFGLLGQRLDQPGLAQAGRAGDGDHAQLALRGLGQRLAELVHLGVAPDEGDRRSDRPAFVGHAAGERADPHHRHRLVAAAHGQRLGGTDVEVARGRPQGLDADHHLVGTRALGQVGGDVRHRAAELEAAALDVAGPHQHQAAVHAGMQAQLEAGRQRHRQRACMRVQRQRGQQGAPRVVLAAARVAEHGQQAVTLHAHDHTAVARHDLIVGLAQPGQQRRVGLGLHQRRQLGRARQVGEDQGDEAPARVCGRQRRDSLWVGLHRWARSRRADAARV